MTSHVRFAAALFLCSCGGSVVFEEPEGGGGAGTTSSTSTSTTTSKTTTTGPTSSSTGMSLCDSHEDCAPGVCIFVTGQCAPACDAGTCDSCGPGLFCDGCATSSCPACADCRGGCVPVTQGRCDEDDPCGGGQVCVFGEGLCHDACGPNGECGDFEFCEFCATGSCCGCDDCVPACFGGR